MEKTFFQILVARVKSQTPKFYIQLRWISGIAAFLCALVMLVVYNNWFNIPKTVADSFFDGAKNIGEMFSSIFGFSFTGTLDPKLIEKPGETGVFQQTEALPANNEFTIINNKSLAFMNVLKNDLNKVINWGEAEIKLLFEQMPVVVKTYETEGLYVCNQIKNALSSPTGALIESALTQIIPGTWSVIVIQDIRKALGVAIPAITNIQANSNGTVIETAYQFVQYLKGLSPKMQNACVLKLLSGMFQALDPNLNEAAADTAAQVVYAKSIVKNPVNTAEPTPQQINGNNNPNPSNT